MNAENAGCTIVIIHAVIALLCIIACVVAHFNPVFWAWSCVVLGAIGCVSASIFHVLLKINDFQIFLRLSMVVCSVCLLLVIPLLSADV